MKIRIRFKLRDISVNFFLVVIIKYFDTVFCQLYEGKRSRQWKYIYIYRPVSVPAFPAILSSCGSKGKAHTVSLASLNVPRGYYNINYYCTRDALKQELYFKLSIMVAGSLFSLRYHYIGKYVQHRLTVCT